MMKVETIVFSLRVYILAFLFGLTIVMGFYASKLHLDAGFQKMLPIGHEYIETFEQYQESQFAGGNRILIVLQSKPKADGTPGYIFTPEFLVQLKEATDDLFFIPGVSRGTVTSLWTGNTRFFQITEDGIASGDVIPGNFKATDDSVEKTQAKMELVRSNSIKANLRGRLVSNDFSAAMITADLQDVDPNAPDKLDPSARLDYFKVAKLLETNLREKYNSDTVSVRIIGFAKLVGDIADGARSVVTFFIVAFFLTVLMVYLYCRSVTLTIVTLASSLCSLVWQFGLLNILGFGLDPLAILVPFLVFAIGVSHGVQQLNMIGAEIAAGRTKEEAARLTFSFLLLPGMVALATCLAGFGTLYIIPIGMIRELAITASIGVGLKIVSNLVMLPLLASYLAPSGEYARKVQEAMASRERIWPYIAQIALPRNAFKMIGLCVILGLVGGYISHGVKFLEPFAVENPKGFLQTLTTNAYRGIQIGDVQKAGAAELRANSAYNMDSEYIVDNFNLGLNVLTSVIETPEGACIDYAVMSMIDRFQWHMANVEGVQTAVGLPLVAKNITALWREGNLKWRGLPRDSHVLSQSVGIVETSSGLLNQKCTLLPLMIFTKDTKAETVSRAIAAVKAFRAAPENQVPGVTIRLAMGNVGIVAATNEVVKASEIPMLLYVYAVVIALVLLTYREWRGSLCCVLPLLLSTIIGNMFLTLAGIGLKISTLPVLAIAVGIGVDYGIYEYNRIQRYMAAGRNAYEAYLQALKDVGSATMFTGFTLAVGVSTWSFSALKFQADMGLLLTFMFMINMIGAVTLLPALIAALEVVFPRSNRVIVPDDGTPYRGH